MKVVITGAGGFLGWHTRVAGLEVGVETTALALGGALIQADAVAKIDGAARVVHLAGVNRGTEAEVHDGNLLFARQLASALVRSENPPRVVVFANSTQAGNGSVYGHAKQDAARVLAAASDEIGAEFVDVLLPNLFGEHGLPFYNSVTATFCHLLAEGGSPEVRDDKELTLLHAQDAADVLLGAVPAADLRHLTRQETVSGLLARLTDIAAVYRHGEIPDISTTFERDLFNTYRSFTFADRAAISLTRHADARGSFFETLRCHGGPGQSSFSTTAPGVTRGDHFHRRKIERFTVLSGRATIALRRVLTDAVVELEIHGDAPVSVDMPTMWAHNITNTGDGVLYTAFWINELFDPQRPDTVPEKV
jgi:UDP-2-acetamido-2,6-beta-L-arabino-hexul-4-ose reductase